MTEPLNLPQQPVVPDGKASAASGGSALHWRKAGLRIGGVMRCCAATLSETRVREMEGEVLKCKYWSSSLIFRDGAWEWNREPNAKAQPPRAAERVAVG